MTFDLSVIQNISVLAYLLVFLGGSCHQPGAVQCCDNSAHCGFCWWEPRCTARRAFALSFAFALGLAITFMLLGIAAALLGSWIGSGSRWWYYLVAVVCFVIGLQMLGVFNFNLPMVFGGLRERIGLKGILGALVLGLVSGLVASQCATPVLAAILTYVMTKGALVYGATLLFVYALGRGVPVVLAGTFTGALKEHAILWDDGRRLSKKPAV